MSATTPPSTTPLTHIDGEPMTIDGARELLQLNPPGEVCMNMHIEGIYKAPFYIAWLLDQLAAAQKPRRRKKS